MDVNDKSLSYFITKDVMFPQLSTIQIEPYMPKKKPTMVSFSLASHGVFGGKMPWHVDPPERHEASSGAAAVNPNPKKRDGWSEKPTADWIDIYQIQKMLMSNLF